MKWFEKFCEILNSYGKYFLRELKCYGIVCIEMIPLKLKLATELEIIRITLKWLYMKNSKTTWIWIPLPLLCQIRLLAKIT